jgi:hypothetical protein
MKSVHPPVLVGSLLGVALACTHASALTLPETAAESATEQSVVSELSPAEADTIVREQAEAKEARENEALERLSDHVTYSVQERKEVSMGNRTLILNRVAPPVLPVQAKQAVAASLQRQYSEAEIQALNAEVDAPKEHRTVMVNATVFDRNLTELRWSDQGQEFVAYSNVDFNYLQCLTDVETDTAYYLFFIGVGNDTAEAVRARNELAREKGLKNYTDKSIPQLPAFTPGRAEYFVLTDDPAIIERDDIFGPIDALHAYYEQNEARLKVEYQRREALTAARERYEAANPETPKDTVINFWPVRGSVYLKNSGQ